MSLEVKVLNPRVGALAREEVGDRAVQQGYLAQGTRGKSLNYQTTHHRIESLGRLGCGYQFDVKVERSWLQWIFTSQYMQRQSGYFSPCGAIKDVSQPVDESQSLSLISSTRRVSSSNHQSLEQVQYLRYHLHQ